MTWESLAAIAQLMAALATLATLLYLALQIRHNSAVLSDSTEDAIATGFSNLNATVANNAALARLFVKGVEDPGALTENEQYQFNFMFRAYFNQYVRLFELYRRGVLAADRWELYAREIAQYLAMPGGRAFRAGQPNPGLRDFYDYIDRYQVDAVFSLGLAQTERDGSASA